MTYNPDTQQTNLLHDLADGITGLQALDQAVAVLIEWGLIDAYFKQKTTYEMKGWDDEQKSHYEYVSGRHDSKP